MPILEGRERRIAEIVTASIVLFVAVDYALIHEHVWANQPGLGYWVAKPIWVGIPMLVAAVWIVRSERPTTLAVLVGGIVGIVSLQLYYTVVPIPMVSGESVQLDLMTNLTEGLMVHLGGLSLAIGIAMLLYAKRGGDD